MITKNGDDQIMDPASKSLDQDRNGDDHSEMVMIKAMLAIIRTWITKRESVMITEKSDSDDQKSIVMITEESGPMVMISEDRVQRAPAYLEPACVATTTLTTTQGIIIIVTRPKPAYGRQDLAGVSLRAHGHSAWVDRK